MSTLTSAAEPKLRSDLIISRQEGAVVLKDPVTGRFYRVGDAEHFITRQLDGGTPLDVVRQRAEEAFGSPPEPGALEGFVATLRRLGLLEAPDSPPDRPPARRTHGSLLYWRFSTFDPD